MAIKKINPAGTSAIHRILSIDIGATGIKAAIIGRTGKFLSDRHRVKTPDKCSPALLMRMLGRLLRPLKDYDCVSIGFPGIVRDGVVITAPNLGTEQWKGFALGPTIEKKLGRPTQLHNDADVQGLAAIDGRGLELVCTLGTGLGTAWFRDGELMPHMDLSHMAIHAKDDFDHYIGDKTLKHIGKKAWNKRLKKLIAMLENVFFYDHLFLGGGNSRCVTIDLPKNVSIVSNEAGVSGGAFVWLPKTPKKRGAAKKK